MTIPSMLVHIFVWFTIFHLINARLPPKDELEFIELATSWKKGREVKLETCLFYNFGYDRELPYNQLNMEPDKAYNVSLLHAGGGLETASECSVVLIANDCLDHVNAVMEIVDDIAEQTNSVPIAAFLLGDLENVTIVVNSSIRDDYSPAMISHPRYSSGGNDSLGNGYLFQVMCQGGWVNDTWMYHNVTDNILIMRDGRVSGTYRDYCPILHMWAYSYYSLINNTLWYWPYEHGIYTDDYAIADHPEILRHFFRVMNIQVDYVYLFPWENIGGIYNKTTGSWNGIIGLIDNDVVDLVIDRLIFSLERCSVVNCIESEFGPMFFYSRYPGKLPPIWNLVRLFTPLVWTYFFVSLFALSFFYNFSSYIYTKMGLKKKLYQKELILMPFTHKILDISNSVKNITFGFSSEIVFVMWALCGGILFFMLESNLLTIMLVPVYEKPLKTIDDILASGNSPFYSDQGSYVLQLFQESPDPNYQIMAERYIHPDSYDHWLELIKRAQSHNDVLYINDNVDDWDNELGSWYQSDPITAFSFTYSGTVSNKKFVFNEELYYCYTRFSDAGLMRNVMKSKIIPPFVEDVVKLTIDHILFPLGLLGVGLIFATIQFGFELLLTSLNKTV